MTVNKGTESAWPVGEHRRWNRFGRLALGCVAMVSLTGGFAAPTIASPTHEQPGIARAQNVDWLSPQTASSLNLGFPVLVPGGVPSPFSGEPSVSASGGYYSLYWMNVAADPTFLQITGQVGGSLPAGSPYDLNVQLFVNASVQGYDAIHDVTPIYDQVWWVADGVLYTVASKNLDGTDSLSLANSLYALEAPSGDNAGGDTPVPTEPSAEPTVEPGPTEAPVQPTVSAQSSVTAGDVVTVSVGNAVNVNLTADGGVFPDSGDSGIYNINGGDYRWQAPSVDTATTFTLTVSSPQSGDTLASTRIAVSPNAQPAQAAQTAVPAVENAGPAPTETQTTQSSPENTAGNGDGTGSPASGATVVPVSSNAGTDLLSDGTDGPPPPVIGGDGTGGIQVVELPKSTGAGPQP